MQPLTTKPISEMTEQEQLDLIQLLRQRREQIREEAIKQRKSETAPAMKGRSTGRKKKETKSDLINDLMKLME